MGFYARFAPTKGALKTYFDTIYSAINAIFGSTGSIDNRLLRSDGTGGKTVQGSAVTVDDDGNITTAIRTSSPLVERTTAFNQTAISSAYSGLSNRS